MPGKNSLLARQYYAHKRNAFWPIMAALFDMDLTADYADRCRALTARGIAVWDVLKSCERSGSLDANIVENTIEINDFVALFSHHSSLSKVFFNGAVAERLFLRRVQPTLADQGLLSGRQLSRLPSTSPANASWSHARKLAAWQAIRDS